MSDAEELLELFDADFGECILHVLRASTWNLSFGSGILVIGEGAKILGPNRNGQDILIVAEYLRVKQFQFVSVL